MTIESRCSCAMLTPDPCDCCSNYPVNLAVSKIGPALMAGNTVVVKPPTQGAVSALQMIQVHRVSSSTFDTASLPP